MDNYKVFKQIGGRKIYFTVEMTYPIQSEEQAIEIADRYFKAGKKNLVCQEGRVIDNDLYLASSEGKYPNTLGAYKHNVWVVTRS